MWCPRPPRLIGEPPWRATSGNRLCSFCTGRIELVGQTFSHIMQPRQKCLGSLTCLIAMMTSDASTGLGKCPTLSVWPQRCKRGWIAPKVQVATHEPQRMHVSAFHLIFQGKSIGCVSRT